MANIGVWGAKGLMDYINRGFTSNLPAAWWLALSTGSPNGFDPLGGEPTGGGASRLTCSWGAAVSASGTSGATAFNLGAMTFGPFSSNWNISGVAIVNTAATPVTTGAGNQMWCGTLANPRAITAGDSMIFAASAITAIIQ